MSGSLPVVTLSPGSPETSEGTALNSSLMLMVRLSAPSLAPVTVTYATADGSAEAGSDYMAQSGTVTFLPGEVTKTISITVLADTAEEEDEDFLVELTDATNAALSEEGDATAYAVILNDDLPAGSPNMISGTGGPDSLNGTNDDDTIDGFEGNDTLSGFGGSDALDGGTGMDTALWAAGRSGFLLRSVEDGGRFVTTVTDLTGSEGSDTLVDVEVLGFAGGARAYGLAGIQQNRVSNVDGGAFDDVLFQNTGTGAVVWQNMTAGGTPGGFGTLLGALPQGWRVFDSADLTGDGRAEILVQDGATGSTYHVSFAGQTPSWDVVTTNVNSQFRAVAAGDATRDGTADVLYRQDNGVLYLADMGPEGFERWVLVGNLGQAWRTVGLGDFNRDGASDVMVQEISTGRTLYRDVRNETWGYVTGGLGDTWVAQGAGDLDGDGFDDAVFQNTATGNVFALNMVGGSGFGGTWSVLASGLTGWAVRGMADVDNDGYDDLVVQNTADGTTYWRNIDQGAASGWGVVTGALGTGWIGV